MAGKKRKTKKKVEKKKEEVKEEMLSLNTKEYDLSSISDEVEEYYQILDKE